MIEDLELLATSGLRVGAPATPNSVLVQLAHQPRRAPRQFFGRTRSLQQVLEERRETEDIAVEIERPEIRYIRARDEQLRRVVAARDVVFGNGGRRREPDSRVEQLEAVSRQAGEAAAVGQHHHGSRVPLPLHDAVAVKEGERLCELPRQLHELERIERMPLEQQTVEQLECTGRPRIAHDAMLVLAALPGGGKLEDRRQRSRRRETVLVVAQHLVGAAAWRERHRVVVGVEPLHEHGDLASPIVKERALGAFEVAQPPQELLDVVRRVRAVTFAQGLGL